MNQNIDIFLLNQLNEQGFEGIENNFIENDIHTCVHNLTKNYLQQKNNNK